LINLTTDQTNWLLAFFTVVTTLLTLYSINLSKGMDTFKKNRKDVRNAIKNSMEFQNVKPIMANIFTLLNSRINIAKKQKVEEIESMIYNSETWVKLDSEIRLLEEKMRQISDVDKVFNDYIVYSSYFSKILFPLVIVVALVIPVFLFGGLLALTVWLTALTEISIGLLIIKWKASRACSKFENYEDIYVNR
jgi:hypothetical protein